MADTYDKKDKSSIYEYALRAKKFKISELIGVEIEADSRDKGAVGNLLQEYYFGVPRNSSPDADFPEAQLELKAFGYWDDNQGSRADQRLALSTIDFMEFEKEVPFEESHLYNKCHNMLFMAYLLELGKARINAEIRHVRLYEFDKIVKADMQQIIRDYITITKKIREGNTSSLSEGDTEFLGAARTGDKNSRLQQAPRGDAALPRRFAFKQSYMTYLIKEYIIPGIEFDKVIRKPQMRYRIRIPRGQSFEEWLDRLDSQYVKKPVARIAKYKKIREITGIVNLKNKNAYSQIGFGMLGIKSNRDGYLLKTNTVVKTVRINSKGVTKESWSFPNFKVEDVPYQEWQDSEMFAYLSEQRFLLQIFVHDGKDYVYKGHLFLKFTPEQLDKYVKDTWENFKKTILAGVKFQLAINKQGKIVIHSNIQGKVNGQIGLIKLHARDVVYDIDRHNITGETNEAERLIDRYTVNGRFLWKPENREKYGCKLPNGDVITQQSFWLNKDYVLEYIKQNGAKLLS